MLCADCGTRKPKARGECDDLCDVCYQRLVSNVRTRAGAMHRVRSIRALRNAGAKEGDVVEGVLEVTHPHLSPERRREVARAMREDADA